MARRGKSEIDDDLIDQFLEGREHSAALLGNDGLIGELKKRLAERMLSAERDVHLDDEAQQATSNHRDGYSHKSVSLADDRVVQGLSQNLGLTRHGKQFQRMRDTDNVYTELVPSPKGRTMSKEAVFTMKLESELRADFMAEAAGEDRPASQIMRELMRGYIEQRRQAREYDDYLRRKVEAGRASMRAGQGRSNDEVEAAFAARRNQVETGQT